ncbi:MAG: NADPH-dependent F420 reductase [Acidimicrobiia bacterium]
MKIGVLGATGPAGMGLAARLASVGHEVIAGSRDPARAEAAVAELRDRWGARVDRLKAGSNADAAAGGEQVVLAVPWEGAVDTACTHADALAGKVVVAMANGLEKKGREFHAILPEEGSVSMAVQAAVPELRVVAAFHLVPAAAFGDLDHPMESDVIACGDDDDARTAVMELIIGIPDLRAFDGGSLVNAVGIEAFAAMLLTINLRHRGKAALRLLGVEGYAPPDPPA